MKRAGRLSQLVGVSLWLVLAAGVSAHWLERAQQPQPQPGEDPRFTGKSVTMEATGLGVSRRRFEAGARSNWHSHERGQLIFVEEGRARTQKRGQAVKELGPGESDYTGPKVEHWHGAAANQPFVQVAVGFGGETKWLDRVTDDQYLGRGK